MTPQRGFTLVETLVALCLLGVAASVMVAPLLRYSQSQQGVSAAQARHGLMERELDRLMAAPFDSLSAMASCVSVTREPLPHTRCIAVAETSSGRRVVTVIITPAQNAARADTLVFERSPR